MTGCLAGAFTMSVKFIKESHSKKLTANGLEWGSNSYTIMQDEETTDAVEASSTRIKSGIRGLAALTAMVMIKYCVVIHVLVEGVVLVGNTAGVVRCSF